MQELRLSVLDGEVSSSPAEVERLLTDLDQHVGPASFAPAPLQDGAKGMFGLDIATLMVSVVSAPATAALVQVLKSYFDSDRVTEIDISGPGGAAKLKLPPGHQMSSDQIRQVIDTVLGAKAT